MNERPALDYKRHSRRVGDGAPGGRELIRSARKQLGMTQRAMATSLGISARSVERYERGEPLPHDIARSLRRMLAARGSWIAFIAFDPGNPEHRDLTIRWQCLNVDCGHVFRGKLAAAGHGVAAQRWLWCPICRASSAPIDESA